MIGLAKKCSGLCQEVLVIKELFRLLKYAKPYTGLVVLAFVSMLATLGLGLLPPLLLRTMIDSAIPENSHSLLLLLVGSYLAINLGLGLANYGQWFSFELVGQRIARDLQQDMHDHLQRLHLEYFRRQKTGDIMSRVTEDISSVQEFLGWGFILLFSNALSITITLGVMLWIDWRLALVTFAAFPFMAYTVLRFDKRIRPIWKRVREELSSLTTVLQENISGVRTVKAFARESFEIEKFAARNQSFFKTNMERTEVEARTQPFIEFLSSISLVALVGYGGHQVVSGAVSAGTLVAFQGFIWNMIWPIRMLGMLLNMLEQALAAAPRLNEILDARAEIADHPEAKPAVPFQGQVEFKEVCFQFSDASEEVLQNISFRVEAGKSLAIVGGTGSGKSTLVGLIPRFFDPSQGAVMIDGVDIREYTLESLRRQVGIVLQDTVLFSASIKDNIAYGNPTADVEELLAPARLAQAHHFIASLPKGYDTPIGERGVGLSGGQKQRVALARALLMNPRILILDEATSSVDTHTEYLIQEGLSEVMQGRTSIIIAKRLSTIQQADYVLVLEGGRVVEAGVPEELIRHNGFFRRMHDSQQFGQEDKEVIAGV
jgi:ATP-binding cassette subfamily B protein